MIRFDAREIDNWADLREAQHDLPELIRKLVLATIDSRNLSAIRFPSGSSVVRSGCDGYTNSNESNPWVPVGQACWELTARNDTSRKADEDYENRTSVGNPYDLQNSTFVFLTCRVWNAKDDWVAAKRSEGRWKDVKAFDADDLVGWLDLAPATAYWFAALIGKAPPSGWVSLEDWWDGFSGGGEWLTPEMVLAGREEDIEAVDQFFSCEPDQHHIQADTADESVAFLAAREMTGNPDLTQIYRTVVVQDAEAWRTFANHAAPLILIRKFVDDTVSNRSAVRNGHRVLTALGAHQEGRGTGGKISRLDDRKLVEAIQLAGMNESQAQNLVRYSAARLQILRRRQMDEASVEWPSWVNEELDQNMVPLLLVGSWDGRKQGDRNVVAQLTGADYQEVERQATSLARCEDAPVEVIGTIYRFISHDEAWYMAASRLVASDLDLFTDVAAGVLSTANPEFDLEPDERYLANVVGKEAIYSKELLTGISHTLALLGVYADRAKYVNHSEIVPYRTVAKVLGDGASWKTWATLSSNLTTLAEASPEAFLDCVDNGINSGQSVFLDLFSQESQSAMGGAPHTGLLWALERLAWSREHFHRIADVLAKLAGIDPGGLTSNRPSSSLRTLFLSWIQFSDASDDQRYTTLRRLIQRYPDVGWGLLIEISSGRWDNVTSREPPNWRPWAQDGATIVPIGDRLSALTRLFRMCVDEVGEEPSRWADMLVKLPELPQDLRDDLFARLIAISCDLKNHPESEKLRDRIRRELHLQRKLTTSTRKFSDEERWLLKYVYDVLSPEGHGANFGWLFDEGAVLPPDFEPDPSIEPQSEIADFNEMHNARVQIVASAHSDDGETALLDLVTATNGPYNVGFSAGHALESRDIAEMVVANLVVGRAAGFEFARGLLWSLSTRLGWDGFKEVLAEHRDQLESAQLAEFYLAAQPANQSVWCDLASEESTVQVAYWRKFRPYLAEPRNGETMQFVAGKLCANGRGPEMLSLLWGFELEPTFLVDYLEQLPRLIRRNSIDEGEARINGYYIAQLFAQLDLSSEITDDVIAKLELPFLHTLSFEKRDLAIRREVLREPTIFAELITALYRRTDGFEEVERSEEQRSVFSQIAFEILWKIDGIPGLIGEDELDYETLVTWITEARRMCTELGRSEVGEHHIGRVLANAGAGKDGIWPREEVREVIESSGSGRITRGIVEGRLNSRDATWRGPHEGGDQERVLAAKYRDDASQLIDQWPFTAGVLNEIASFYDTDARWHDQQSDLHD